MGSMSEHVTDLYNEWKGAERYWQACQARAEEAAKKASEAEQRLAKKIAPQDQRPDETIGVWLRTAEKEERLLTVRFNGVEYEVKERR